MDEILRFITHYKELITIAFSALALLMSWIALSRSKRIQRQQIELEKKTAKLSEKQMQKLEVEEKTVPTIFLTELSGHLASLTRTLDHVNPTWMNRGHKDAFNEYEVSHSNLKTDTYESYIDKIEDISIRVSLGSYYQEVYAFNSRGTELLESGPHDALLMSYFVQGASLLIRSAYDLCENLLSLMDRSVIEEERVYSVIENLRESRPYSLTVANASHLNATDLIKIKNKFAEHGIESIDNEKYPHPGYILNLHTAVFGRDMI